MRRPLIATRTATSFPYHTLFLSRCARRRPRHRAVAIDAELAAAGALRPLEDDAAHRRRKRRMADAVEHHLCHRALPGIAFRGRFVIDGVRSEEHTSELQSLMRT